MNRHLLTLGILLGFSCSALGGFNLPKYCLNHEQIAEAKEQAVKEKKPIAYFLSDKDTNCGLCSDASEAFLKAMGRSCIVVYLNVKKGSEYTKCLDKKVDSAMRTGKYYPKIVMTSSDGDKILANILYEDYKKDSKGTIKSIKKTIQDFKKENK